MEYKETLKIDIKNINKNIKTIWRPIYAVIDAPFFEETDFSPQDVLDLCFKNPNQPQFLTSDFKTVLKINGYVTRVI